MLNQNEQGQGSEDKRVLPWTDNMDDDVLEDEDDNYTEVVEDTNVDTEAG